MVNYVQRRMNISIFKMWSVTEKINYAIFFLSKWPAVTNIAKTTHRITTAILCKFKSLAVLGEYLSPNNLKFSNNNIQKFETSHPSGIMSQRCNYIKLLKTSNTNDRSYKIRAKISKKKCFIPRSPSFPCVSGFFFKWLSYRILSRKYVLRVLRHMIFLFLKLLPSLKNWGYLFF